tara:strand:- start:163 stop:612 length:450 start_codon:yes stop_codon:yes gene_type:complete
MNVMTKIERPTEAPKNLKEMQKLYDDLMSEGEKEEFLMIAHNYSKLCDYQKMVWPDLKYRRTFVRAAMCIAAKRKHNLDTNVTQLAAHLELSRQSTMRRCKVWSDSGLCTITNKFDNRESFIYGTHKGMSGLIKYVGLLKTRFTVCFVA